MIRQPEHQVTWSSQHSEHLIHSTGHIRQVLDHLEAYDGVKGVVSKGQSQGVSQRRHDSVLVPIRDAGKRRWRQVERHDADRISLLHEWPQGITRPSTNLQDVDAPVRNGVDDDIRELSKIRRVVSRLLVGIVSIGPVERFEAGPRFPVWEAPPELEGVDSHWARSSHRGRCLIRVRARTSPVNTRRRAPQPAGRAATVVPSFRFPLWYCTVRTTRRTLISEFRRQESHGGG